MELGLRHTILRIGDSTSYIYLPDVAHSGQVNPISAPDSTSVE